MYRKKHIFRRVFAFLISLITLLSFSVCVFATVPMKDTRHTRWIDRINFPERYEDQFIAFYETLEEACDNDGVDDILIDDVTFGTDSDTTDNILIDHSSISIVAVKLTLYISSSDELETVFDEYYPYVAAVYAAFDRDHPEVFWLQGATSYNAITEESGNNGQYTMSILFYLKNRSNGYDLRYSEYSTKDELAEAISARDTRVNNILQSAQNEGYYTDYDKVRYFNYLLTHTNEYNTTYNPNQDTDIIPDSAYESYCALMGNIGLNGPVCEGYARAIKVLCDKAGIPCVLVDGDALSGGVPGPHMWNYVQIQGGWYALDTTWNDPSGGTSGAISYQEHEDWLLVGADTVVHGMRFIDSHPVSNTVITVVGGFTNGPQLESDRYMLPSDMSYFEYIRTYFNSSQSLEFEYGDTITVKAKIVNSNGVAATDQTLDLLYGSTVIASSNSAEDGEYTLEYDTSEKIVPTGDMVALRLRFVGGENMPAVSAPFSVAITPTQTRIYFRYEDLLNDIGYTYNGEKPEMPEPELEFSNGETLECNIVYFYRSLYDIDKEYVRGLPKDAGDYDVIARAVPSSGDFYSFDETKNSIIVSISKRDITVRADDKTKEHGQNDPKLTYTVDPNTPLVEGESLVGALSRKKGEDVGEYDILQNTLNNENNPNYDIRFVGGTLTITDPNADGAPNGTNTPDSTDTADTESGNGDEIPICGDERSEFDYITVIYAAVPAIIAFGIIAIIVVVIIAVIKAKNKKNKEE